MTSFEQMLIDKGYVKHVYSFKTHKREIPRYHELSTMGNLDHRYIHPDKEGEIIFGLHEAGKPATLISPRPRIEIKRPDGLIEDERLDNSMNHVLNQIPNEQIYEAMFDKRICFKFDLTK